MTPNRELGNHSRSGHGALRTLRPGARDGGSPPAPPFIVNLGTGLLVLGIAFAVFVASDVLKGKSRDDATLWLAGTFATIGTLCLMAGWTVTRRHARIWREGYPAEATVTRVKEAAVQITGLFPEEPRWVIEYSYRDASGNPHTGNSGYVPRHIAATWRAGDKGQIRVDAYRPAESVWIALTIAGPHEPAPGSTRPPSFFRVAARVPSFWTGPFIVVVGFVIAGVSAGKGGPLEGLTISLCGIVLFLAGCRKVWIAHGVLRNGVDADGTVVSIKKNYLSGRVTEWRYVMRYRYKDDRGKWHESREYLSRFEAFGWTREPRGSVRFDPRHPGRSVWMGASDHTAHGAEPTHLSS